MPEIKHFEKGDILKFADVGPGVDESAQSGNCWLVIDLTTIMDSSGMMRNEYVLLHKVYETYYFIDQADRKEAEALLKVVGHIDISELSKYGYIRLLRENRLSILARPFLSGMFLIL